MTRPEIIYVVGLQKTGLGSLNAMFARAGYKRSRGRDVSRENKRVLRDYIDRKSPNADTYFRNDTLFVDWPAPLFYKEAFHRFGDRARFILSLRSSPEKWINSLKTHSLTVQPWRSKHRLIYGYRRPHGREKEHIEYYNNHAASVRKFFADNDAMHLLCEVCVEEPASVDRMLEKLSLSDAGLAHEHRNTGRERVEKFAMRTIYNRVAIRLDGLFR